MKVINFLNLSKGIVLWSFISIYSINNNFQSILDTTQDQGQWDASEKIIYAMRDKDAVFRGDDVFGDFKEVIYIFNVIWRFPIQWTQNVRNVLG